MLAFLDVAGRPFTRADAIEEVGPVLAVSSARGFHFGRFESRALFRDYLITAAVKIHGAEVPMEQNAAALLEHRLRIALAIFVAGEESGILVDHLQRIRRFAIVVEIEVPAHGSN